MRLVLALLGLLATPAFSDPACLAAPTQDCVFLMARAQAKAQMNPGAVVSGLIVTAALQESAGRADWRETLNDILPAVQNAEPDPEKALDRLAFSLFAVSLSGLFGDDPPLRALSGVPDWMNAKANEIKPPSPEKAAKNHMHRLGAQGDMAKIEAEIMGADPSQRLNLAKGAAGGLIGSDRIDEAFGLLRLVPSVPLSHDIAQATIDHTLRSKRANAALALSRRFADDQDRALARITTAAHLAERGQLAPALRVLADPVVQRSDQINLHDREKWTESLARAGQTEQALRLIGPGKTFKPWTQRAKVQIIAAAVSGDFATFFLLIDQTESHSRNSLLSDAVQALWHLGGSGGVDQLLALMPKSDLPGALAALGRAQIVSQNLAAALATDARLAALDQPDEAQKSLHRELAPFLAKKGRVAEAVAMADALGHPWATAHVAAALPPKMTD